MVKCFQDQRWVGEMKLDRYTTKVQGFIQEAHDKALKLKHQSISAAPLQVMLEDAGIQNFLQKLELNVPNIKEKTQLISDKTPKVTSLFRTDVYSR